MPNLPDSRRVNPLKHSLQRRSWILQKPGTWGQKSIVQDYEFQKILQNIKNTLSKNEAQLSQKQKELEQSDQKVVDLRKAVTRLTKAQTDLDQKIKQLQEDAADSAKDGKLKLALSHNLELFRVAYNRYTNDENQLAMHFTGLILQDIRKYKESK